MTSLAASRGINALPRSGIRALAELAAQTPGAVRLEIGDPVAAMPEAYRARRDVALAVLDAAGVGYVRPSGAFYLMVDVGDAEPSEAVAHRLLDEQQVAVTPGSPFGSRGEGMVRVSLAASEHAVSTGLERLAAALAGR